MNYFGFVENSYDFAKLALYLARDKQFYQDKICYIINFLILIAGWRMADEEAHRVKDNCIYWMISWFVQCDTFVSKLF